MTGTGKCYILGTESVFDVTHADVREGELVSVEWQETTCRGHFRATKADGGLYRGQWR